MWKIDGVAVLLVGVMAFATSAQAAEKPASSPVAPPAKPITLNGRLEEISGRGVSLPVQLTVPGLKAQLGRVDNSGLPPKRLVSQISSFPPDLYGHWGARLGLRMAYYNPRVSDSSRLIEEGQEGLGLFSFGWEGRSMSLKPARVWFTPVMAKVKDIKMPVNLMDKTQPSDADQMSKTVPVLALGKIDAANIDGNSMTQSVVRNTLVQLKPGVYEENIILEQVKTQAHTGIKMTDYVESVVRMTKYKPDLMYAQVAYVQYNSAREAMSQYVLEGWVTRNWQAAAQGIEQLTGYDLQSLGYTDLPAVPVPVKPESAGGSPASRIAR